MRRLVRAGLAVHVALYRWTGGRIGGRFGKSRVLLLETRGRRSGAWRTTPLFYLEDGRDVAVVASNGGRDAHPAWYLNLRVSPEAGVQIGPTVFRARAETASPADRDRLWPRFVDVYAGYAAYQRKTERRIPLVVLRPLDA